MLYIIYPDVDVWQYVMKDHQKDTDEVHTRALNKYCSFWQRVVRKLLGIFRLPSCLVFGKVMRRELASLGEGDSVLLCEYLRPSIVNAIAVLVKPEVKKHFWLWNPVGSNPDRSSLKAFKYLKICNYSVSSFHFNATGYAQKCFNQFFRMKERNSKVILYDFYFIGQEKERLNELLDTKRMLKGYRLYFKIVRKPEETISYEENVENILHSECIIDCVSAHQRAMTLRPLEALCYRKKLLTNNKEILNADFYNPHNIFVLGIDDIDNLPSFLAGPFEEIPGSIRNRYSVESWLEHFK